MLGFAALHMLGFAALHMLGFAEELRQVVYDDVGTAGAKRVGTGSTIDADHETEVSRTAGGDAGQRVLEHDRSFAWDTDLLGGVQERLGLGFALQPLGLGDRPVHDDLEAPEHAGGLEHIGRIRRARHDGDLGAPLGERVEEPHRTRVGLDALVPQHLAEDGVLAIPESAHGLGIGGIAGFALRQVDAARGEQVGHPLVPRFAVEVREVVGLGVRLGAARLEEGAEHLRPGPHVHVGGRRDHPVEVEQGSVVVVPSHI